MFGISKDTQKDGWFVVGQKWFVYEIENIQQKEV